MLCFLNYNEIPVKLLQNWQHFHVPESLISGDNLPVKLLWRPDSKVAVFHLHHVEHPLDLVVVIMILLQCQCSIRSLLQAEVGIIVHKWFKWFIATFERTLDLHYALRLLSLDLDLSIWDTDQIGDIFRWKLFSLENILGNSIWQCFDCFFLILPSPEYCFVVGNYNGMILEKIKVKCYAFLHSMWSGFWISSAISALLTSSALMISPNLWAGTPFFTL